MPHEQLRRARQHPAVLRQGDQRAERHRLRRPQAPVQRQRRADAAAAQALRVVDLVGLARADAGVDLVDRGRVGRLVIVRRQAEHASGRRGLRAFLLRQPGVHPVPREPRAVRKTQQTQAAGRRRQPGQAHAPFVVGQQHQVHALRQIGRGGRPDRVQLGRVRTAVFPEPAGVQPAHRPVGRGAGIVQQGEDRSRRRSGRERIKHGRTGRRTVAQGADDAVQAKTPPGTRPGGVL